MARSPFVLRNAVAVLLAGPTLALAQGIPGTSQSNPFQESSAGRAWQRITFGAIDCWPRAVRSGSVLPQRRLHAERALRERHLPRHPLPVRRGSAEHRQRRRLPGQPRDHPEPDLPPDLQRERLRLHLRRRPHPHPRQPALRPPLRGPWALERQEQALGHPGRPVPQVGDPRREQDPPQPAGPALGRRRLPHQRGHRLRLRGPLPHGHQHDRRLAVLHLRDQRPRRHNRGRAPREYERGGLQRVPGLRPLPGREPLVRSRRYGLRRPRAVSTSRARRRGSGT